MPEDMLEAYDFGEMVALVEDAQEKND